MVGSRRFAFVAVAALSATQTAPAALLTRDSLDFENDADSGSTASYEAGTIPQSATPAWTAPGNSPAGSYGSADNELTLTTETGNNRYFHTGAFWSGDVSRTTGYTVEFAVRVDAITDTRGPALFRLADGTQLVELEWRTEAVVWNTGNTATTTSLTIDPTVYRTYRIAYDPSANENAGAYAAWIDGVLVSDTLGGINSTANQLLFGDTSGSRYGGTTTWDYIRWDTTGAFAPVPEPASLALLAIGGLGATLRGRARR